MAEAGEADAYRKQLVRALVRRGQARAALGLLHDAETDYVEALRQVLGRACCPHCSWLGGLGCRSV
jgi:hypothetical protein